VSELYQRGTFKLVGFGRALVSVLDRGNEPLLVARPVADMLASCAAFATLEQHAGRICRELGLPAEKQGEVLAVLTGAAERGLLVSDSGLLEKARAHGATSQRVRLETIGIVTRDRPEVLRRCLQGFTEHLRAFDRRVQVVVIDSSPVPDAGRAETVERFRRAGTTLRWMGLAEKVAFADALAREAVVDPAVARFAVLGVNGEASDVGANRNALLLALAGEAFYSTDDDMQCHLREPAEACDRILLSADDLPVPATLHADFAAARDRLLPSGGCLLDRHEELLGRDLGACLSERDPDRISWRSVGSNGLTGLLAGQARILATFGGYYGDAGARFPSFYLWSGPQMQSQLLGGVEQYRALVTSRQMVRVAPVTTVTSSRFSMCGSVALDARALLPPFFPAHRGEDLAFGMLLGSCFDLGLFAHLPQAVAHQPWEPRRASEDNIWNPVPSPALHGLIFQILELAEGACRLAPRGAPRMRLTGRWIRELASLAPADFEGLLRERVTAAIGRNVAQKQALLEQAKEMPPYWAADLRRFIDHQVEMGGHPDRAIPQELLEGSTREDALGLVQDLVAQYGQLLEAWPDLFSAAARLRARDNPLPTRSA
jgi:hypothetical protein